jgi:hypothetical protein
MSDLAELQAECHAHGIRLLPDGGLAIDAPEKALTPELLDRPKAGKAELLAMLRPSPEAAPTLPAPPSDAPAKPAKAVCRCGSTTWQDFAIHDGHPSGGTAAVVGGSWAFRCGTARREIKRLGETLDGHSGKVYNVLPRVIRSCQEPGIRRPKRCWRSFPNRECLITSCRKLRACPVRV